MATMCICYGRAESKCQENTENAEKHRQEDRNKESGRVEDV